MLSWPHTSTYTLTHTHVEVWYSVDAGAACLCWCCSLWFGWWAESVAVDFCVQCWCRWGPSDAHPFTHTHTQTWLKSLCSAALVSFLFCFPMFIFFFCHVLFCCLLLPCFYNDNWSYSSCCRGRLLDTPRCTSSSAQLPNRTGQTVLTTSCLKITFSTNTKIWLLPFTYLKQPCSSQSQQRPPSTTAGSFSHSWKHQHSIPLRK